MAVVAIFHSVLGLRAGTEDAAARLTAAGHDVRVVDQYEGRSFDDYEAAMAFGEGELGFPELARRGMAGVADLEPGYVALGFSNGSTMAELCALQAGAGAVVCFAGAMPPAVLADFGAVPEGTTWPAGVSAQVHLAAEDPFREEATWLPDFEAAVRAAPAEVTTWTYPGGHLFTDPSLPEEFDAAAAELAWQRVLAFLARTAPTGEAGAATE
jgi:dienelactone hydrolase